MGKPKATQRALFAAITALAAAGCAVLAGLGTDYTTGNGGVDSSSSETAAPDVHPEALAEATAEAQVDGGDAAPMDAAAVDGTCPLDAGYMCTPIPVPAGWSLVAFVANQRPACPSGYGLPADVVSNVSALPYSCLCGCSGTPFCRGDAVVQVYGAANCSGSPGHIGFAGGGCQVSQTVFTVGQGYELEAGLAASSIDNCVATVDASAKPAVTDDKGETCPAGGPFGVCANGGTCTPAPGPPFFVCITTPGDRACPAQFPTKTSVSTGNPGYVDTRGCAACTCVDNLTCTGIKSVDFHSDNGCQLPTLTVGATCTAIIASVTSRSYDVKYAMTGTASCSETAGSKPTGDAALDPSALATICCP